MLSLVRTALPHLSLAIASFLPTARQFSSAARKSTADDVAVLTMPQETREEFARRLSLYYKPLEDDKNIQLKPITKKEGERCHDELMDVIQTTSPSLLDAIAEVRERSPIVTIFNGVPVATVPKSAMPRNPWDLADNSDLKRMLRSTEATMLAFSELLGVKPALYQSQGLAGYIYATEMDKDNPSSFRSSVAGLKWHNDGWANGEAIPYVVLLGVVGNKDTQTRIIPCEAIIRHFVENGKEHLLQVLNEECYLENDDEAYSLQRTRILNTEKSEINFAHYGRFGTHDSDSEIFKEALSYLMKTLRTIPPISLSIADQQLVRIENGKALHERTPSPNLIGNRLLMRVLGDPQKPKTP